MPRRVLVTGANKGIGFAIVNRCLSDHSDCHCVLACRSKQRGEEAMQLLCDHHEDWKTRMSVLEMDTSSEESIKRAAEILTAQLCGDKLYAIVNNAGIGTGSIAEILQTNVYGPYFVDRAFLPLLAHGGRIVNISSGAGPRCVQSSNAERRKFFMDTEVTWTQIVAAMQELGTCENTKASLKAKGFGFMKGPFNAAYGASKALLNCYTVQMARDHPEFVINACSPGAIATDFFVKQLGWAMCFVKCCLATPDKGTRAPMHLLFGSIDGSGLFYHKSAKVTPLDTY